MSEIKEKLQSAYRHKAGLYHQLGQIYEAKTQIEKEIEKKLVELHNAQIEVEKLEKASKKEPQLELVEQ